MDYLALEILIDFELPSTLSPTIGKVFEGIWRLL